MPLIDYTANSKMTHHLTTQAGKHLSIAAMCGALLSATALGQGVARVVSCESLAKLALPNTTIIMAQTVAAGEFEIPVPPRTGGTGGAGGPGGGLRVAGGAPVGPDLKGLPAFCRVAAILRPTSDSDIRIEVWLPQSTWNGTLLGVGGGGWAGHIFYTGNPLGLIDAIRLGYAAVNTDAGHEGNDGSGSMDAVANFACAMSKPKR